MASSHVTMSIPVTVCQVMRFPDWIQTYPNTSRKLNHVFAPRNRLKEVKRATDKPLERWSHHFSPFPTHFSPISHHFSSDTGCIIGGSLDDLSGIAYQLISHTSHLQGTWALLSFFYSWTWNSLYSSIFSTYIFLICSNASIPHLNVLSSPVIP